MLLLFSVAGAFMLSHFQISCNNVFLFEVAHGALEWHINTVNKITANKYRNGNIKILNEPMGTEQNACKEKKSGVAHNINI